MEWGFSRLAGIDTDSPGYKRILIMPVIPNKTSAAEVKPIDWVNAVYDCIRGRIASRWKRIGDNLEFQIEIPANTSAFVVLPVSPGNLFEGGIPITRSREIRVLYPQGTTTLMELGSGQYKFLTSSSQNR